MSNSLNTKDMIVKCKNCGSSCLSNFCPNCGQSTKEKRLENRTFFIGIISGLSRINKGFLFTAWNLLIHPWKVVRDYIQCRRVRYVAPISMLIIMCFISAFIVTLMSAETPPAVSDMSSSKIPFLYRIMLSTGNYLMNNAVAQNLTIYIPALVAIPMVYWKAGARKYNLAEYFAAMIYMATSILIFNVITLPLSIFSPSVSSTLRIGYSILMSSIGMYKAFPGGSKKRRISYFVLYLIVVVIIYLLLFLMLGLLLRQISV